jgi:dihydrofolate synthase/folylpolyglutamate synthase
MLDNNNNIFTLTDIMQSLTEWLNYLEALNPHKIILGLERLTPVAQQLNITHFSCPVITVTGTNGKGSCVAILEAILTAAGYRVGAYTSPHLLRFNERIRINTQEINDEVLCNAFAVIQQEVTRLKIPLTYFEFITLAALKIFRDANLDVLILEVGLGGRLDAVNIISADIAVITTVDIDHTEWLGKDRASIAREKAGIFRSKHDAICGDFDPPQNLLEIAKELNVRLHCIHKDFSFSQLQNTWHWQSKKILWKNLPLPKFTCQNAATALMVIELLQAKLTISLAAIQNGLLKAFLPGRLQQCGNIIFDVAHNPHATHWLAKQLAVISKQRYIAVIGMLADKDIPGSLAPFCQQIDAWYVGTLPGPRGADSSVLLRALQAMGIKRCYNFASVAEAFLKAKQACENNDRIVVFGSFYTVATCMLLQ